MSLLGFFRRRQKMVMIIMAVLMVSFLIGFKGFDMLFERKRDNIDIARTAYGEIKVADRQQADSDVATLIQLRNIAASNQRWITGELDFRILTGERPMDQGYAMLLRTFFANGQELANQQASATMSYAMLLQEADKQGVRVSDSDVDGFFARMGLVDENYKSYINQMRTRRSEDGIRQCVKNWLKIDRYFTAAMIDTPPSEEEILYLYRDNYEQIKLDVLVFDANQYLDKVTRQFTPEEVAAQLKKFNKAVPGTVQEDNPFGLGYLQLDRKRILYLLFPRDVIERAVKPSDADLRKYYSENKDQFAIPTPPSAPANAPTTYKSYLDVRAGIARKLASEAANAKIADLALRAESVIAKHPGPGKTSGNTYQWTRDQMLDPAEANAALSAHISLAVSPEPIGRVVDKLARAAGLDAIVFPFGEHGGKKLDPNIQVKLSATDITLKECLTDLARQAAWPDIEWGMIEEFPKVLFPVGGPGGADSAPIIVGDTPKLVDFQTIQKDPVLGKAMDSTSRQPMVQLVFGGPVKLNTDGPTLDVFGDRAGRLIWRVVEEQAQSAPEEARGDLLDQVQKDLRMIDAFKLAEHAAQSISSVLAFDQATRESNAEVVHTPYVSRSSLMTQPIPGIEIPAIESTHKAFMQTVFSLAPQNVEPPKGEDGNVLPYDKPTVLGSFSLPAKRQALVMKRTGYKPLVKTDYENKYHLEILDELMQNTRLLSFRWFLAPMIQQRVGFQGQARTD